MAEKKKVKYTPPRDKTIPKELKKEKPISSAAEAQEDVEEGLPKDTRKSSGSKGSLSKTQDDLEAGKITSDEAQDKAGIKEDEDTTVEGDAKMEALRLKEKSKVEEEKLAKKSSEIALKLEQKEKAEADKLAKKIREENARVEKVEKFKKITLEDGHTYHTAEKDAVCSSCMLPKNKTTAKCFKHELSPIALRKFNDGLVDYVDGVWVLLEEDNK